MKDADRRIGRYWIVGGLGQGGMGLVFRAWDQDLKRWVALKLLKQIGDDTAREYFVREAELAASLEHPNIAKVYEVGDHEGTPFIAMQLIEGETLGSAARTMSMADKLQALRNVSEAVGYAHEKKVIHRDLKPGNIMVDREGRVYVMDFGLAKQQPIDGKDESFKSLGGSTAVVGTPNYMPPEQAQGRATEQSDVYSIGATLYELVTGRPPFMGDSIGEVLVQVMGKDPVWPRKLNPATPPDLEGIILKSLEKDPQKRYGSSAHLIEDLERFNTHQPLRHAKRPTLGYVLWLAYRRNRLVSNLVGGFLLAAIIGVIVYVQSVLSANRTIRKEWVRAEENAEQAIKNEQRAVANEKEALRQEWDARLELSRNHYRKSFEMQAQGRTQAACAYLLRAVEVAPPNLIPEGFQTSWENPGWALPAWTRYLQLRRSLPDETVRFRGHSKQLMWSKPLKDGRRIASASGDGKLIYWEQETGKPLKTFTLGSEATWRDVNPSGRVALFRGSGGGIRVHDLEKGEDRCELKQDEWDMVIQAMALSPDGRYAIGGSFKNIYLWDATTGEILWMMNSGTFNEELARLEREQSRFGGFGPRKQGPTMGICWDAAFDENGKLGAIISGAYVVLVDVDKQDLLDLVITQGPQPMQVEFVPDFSRPVRRGLWLTIRAQGSVYYWTPFEENPLSRLQGPGPVTTHYAIHPSKPEIAVCYADGSFYRNGTIQVFDMTTGHAVETIDGFEIYRISYSADGSRLVGMDIDGSIRVLTFGDAGGSIDYRFDSRKESYRTFDRISLSRDGSIALLEDESQHTLKWDIPGMRTLAQSEGAASKNVPVLSRDGRRALHVNFDGSGVLWDPGTGEILTRIEGFGATVWKAWFGPKEKQLIFVVKPGSIGLVDTRTGETKRHLTGTTLTHVRTPHGRFLLTDGNDADRHPLGREQFKQHAGALKVLQEISDAEDDLHEMESRYGDLETLVATQWLYSEYGKKEQGGYRFEVRAEIDRWAAQATPLDPESGLKSFLVVPGGAVYMLERPLSSDELFDVPSGAWSIHPWEQKVQGFLRVIDLESGRDVGAFNTGAKPICFGVTPDGRRVVSGHEDGSLRIWDTASGEAIRVDPREGQEPRTLHFPDNETVLVELITDGPQALRLVSLADGSTRWSLSEPGGFDHATFMPGWLVAYRRVFSDDVAVREINGGRILREYSRTQTRFAEYAFDPVRGRLAIGHTIHKAGKESTLRLGAEEEHSHYAVAFTPDGAGVITICGSGLIRLWDLDSGKQLHSVDIGRLSDAPRRFVQGPRPLQLGLELEEESLILDFGTGRVIRSWGSGGIEFNRAGSAARVGRQVYDLMTGDQLASFGDLAEFGFLPGGGKLLVGLPGRSLVLGLPDLVREQEYLEIDLRNEESPRAPDGRTLRRIGKVICLYDAAGELRHRLADATSLGEPTSFVFSPDYKRALVAQQNTVGLWDLETGRQLKLLRGHRNQVTAVRFRPDGRTAISGSQEGRIVLWDLLTGIKLEEHLLDERDPGRTVLVWNRELDRFEPSPSPVPFEQDPKRPRMIVDLGLAEQGRLAIIITGVKGEFDDWEKLSLRVWDLGDPAWREPPSVHPDAKEPYFEFDDFYSRLGQKVIRTGPKRGQVQAYVSPERMSFYLERARAALNAGDGKSGEMLAKQALVADPGNVEARVLLSWAFLPGPWTSGDPGRLSLAIKHLEDVRDKAPDPSEAIRVLAEARLCRALTDARRPDDLKECEKLLGDLDVAEDTFFLRLVARVMDDDRSVGLVLGAPDGPTVIEACLRKLLGRAKGEADRAFLQACLRAIEDPDAAVALLNQAHEAGFANESLFYPLNKLPEILCGSEVAAVMAAIRERIEKAEEED